MTWHANTGRSVPYRLQQQCFKRDQWTCQQCGYEGRQHKGDLHADHIMNRAEGGQHVLANLTTLCIPCHTVKTRQEQRRGHNRRSGRAEPKPHPAYITPS